ncbi:calcium-binding protein [Roseomonas genomospecies 6]|uniref:calcium-binding protein n=1 Tax=Roseomonas genomospecies 6 TaxID=214106 RepID=UPI00142E9A75|nr:hypothetical protein [Roseomonas genomospecies 6]
MRAPTNDEQYLLELVNRFRLSPQSELTRILNSADPKIQSALRVFGVDLSLVASQAASLKPLAPLAWNGAIDKSAVKNWAENAASNVAGDLDFINAQYAVSWGPGGTGGMLPGLPFRANLINAALNEVGITVSPGTTSGTIGVSELLADTGKTYALGVVYNDLNKNGFYDPGEGVGGATVVVGSQIVQTTASGGWQAAVGPGSYTVTFSGAGFTNPLSQTVTVGSSSVKIDAETASHTAAGAGTAIDPATMPTIAVNIDGVGGLATMSLYSGPVTTLETQWLGSAANEAVIGSSRNDFINLLAGNDAIDAGAGNDVLDGGTGSNFLTGGAGIDTFFIDGRGGQVTWGTITDFQKGEMVTLWGYKPGVSGFSWVDSAGADGFRGRTLHADLDGNGSIDASITFSGTTAATTNQFTILPGQVGDSSYLAVMYT